ncbi:MAG: hypothetical protein WC100_01695 [Sterolibacterium sp.]
MAKDYKALYEASKREHDKTWDKLRKSQSKLRMSEMNYVGAMSDLDCTVATMRKHLLAMMQYLELNYPQSKDESK